MQHKPTATELRRRAWSLVTRARLQIREKNLPLDDVGFEDIDWGNTLSHFDDLTDEQVDSMIQHAISTAVIELRNGV